MSVKSMSLGRVEIAAILAHHLGGLQIIGDHLRLKRSLTVSEIGLTLSNFDDIAVGIANVAAGFAVLFYRLSDELSAALSP